MIEKNPVGTFLPERNGHAARDGGVGHFLYVAWHVASPQPHQPHVRGDEGVIILRAEMSEAIQCVVVEIAFLSGQPFIVQCLHHSVVCLLRRYIDKILKEEVEHCNFFY